jgi:translation initiation factor 2 subunit 1
MLIKRIGYPEESDLVMCTVTNIQHNSVFVGIHEFDKPGMIPISEIAPGRIRNIRDYVTEGKVIVCKVLRVNQERGYIDLSLRRVGESQRRQKSDEIKQETKAEKIIELTAQSMKIPFQDMYSTIADKVLKQYFYIYQAFEDVINDQLDLKTILDEKLARALEKTIREKIRPKEIVIAGDLTLSVWEEKGVDIVKDALITINKKYDTMKISYLGGGRYRMIIKGADYKTLEKVLKDSSDYVLGIIKKHKGKADYERVKNLSENSEDA